MASDRPGRPRPPLPGHHVLEPHGDHMPHLGVGARTPAPTNERAEVKQDAPTNVDRELRQHGRDGVGMMWRRMVVMSDTPATSATST